VDPSEKKETYLNELASTADQLIERFGVSVIFVPQCIDDGGNDVQVALQVLERIKNKDKAVVLKDDLSPYALQTLYEQFEVVIGTRMHANILAMTVFTPVVAIAYEHKTFGIMSMLGLNDFALPIDDMKDMLWPLTRRVWQERQQIKSHLKENIPDIRKKTVRAAGLLEEFIGVR
jgi:colanic acid/amylovoran biosynthesis protein